MRNPRRRRAGGRCLVVVAVLLAGAVRTFAAGAPAKPPPRRTPLEEVLLTTRGPKVRLKKDALNRTLAALRDPAQKLETRIKAVALVAMTKERRALPALVTLLKRPEKVDLKVAVVWALGEIGDPAAIPALLKLQAEATGPHPRIRYKKTVTLPGGDEFSLVDLIEYSIGRLGQVVVDQYVRILAAPSGSYRSQSPTVTNLQRAALAVLVCVGDRDYRALKALMDVVRSPEEAYPPDFRQSAAFGLGRALVARRKEFQVVRARDKVSEEITRVLCDFLIKMKRGRAREYVASALSIAQPTYAVTLLVRHFADESPEKVRLRTIEALGMLRSRESVEALVWALEHEKSPALRWRAAFGLGLCGADSKTALDALKKALRDESPRVRSAALDAIGRLHAKASVTLIAPELKSRDPRVRAAAARALGLSHDETAVEHLVRAMEDKEPIVRAAAVAALAGLPSRRALDAIIKATKDDDRLVRFAALRVLHGIRGARAYAALLGLLNDPDRKIRSDARNALYIARAHHRDALKKALIYVITDPGNPASADACDMANFPKDAAVVAALRQAARDRRPAVRASAVRMLRRMGLR